MGKLITFPSLEEMDVHRMVPFGSADTLATSPALGHELIDFKSLGLIPVLGGAEQGTNTEGDIVQFTADGRDISELWRDYQDSLQVFNTRRDAIINFLTYSVSNVIEDVPQGGQADFEEASEFGEPKGIRGALNYFSLAYDFKWYDVALRYTWKFLADSTAAQVDAVHQQAMDADNRLVFRQVMRTVFNNANQKTDIRNQPYTVYRFYNADGTVPPSYGSNTFDSSHSHYSTSGAAVIDSGDVEALIGQLSEHGYSSQNGARIVLMVHSHEGAQIRRFRANTVNNNSASALYDFVPAVGQPAMIVPNTTGLIGTQVAGTLDGLNVIGSYGNAIIVEDDFMPSGYVFAFATGGPFALTNPIGFREHANPSLRGLKLLPGNKAGYPLLDSFYQHGFGTGVRQRGAGAVMQITANASYAVPAAYV